MDELIIGEKKYISSKQAAKVTGYAKDYVGQLCREGRVPARLVGRGWYVLESAINDHRFGDPKTASVVNKEDRNEEETTPSSALQSPRYMAVTTEILPSVNRLKTDVEEVSSPHPQDTWQAWFDTFESVANASVVDDTEVEESTPTSEVGAPTESVGEEDTPVSIRAIHNSQYQPLPAFEEPVLHHHVEVVEESNQEELDTSREEPTRARRGFKTIQMAGMLVALIMTITAAFGSGYFDRYIISNSTARVIAGVILYQR